MHAHIPANDTARALWAAGCGTVALAAAAGATVYISEELIDRGVREYLAPGLRY